MGTQPLLMLILHLAQECSLCFETQSIKDLKWEWFPHNILCSSQLPSHKDLSLRVCHQAHARQYRESTYISEQSFSFGQDWGVVSRSDKVHSPRRMIQLMDFLYFPIVYQCLGPNVSAVPGYHQSTNYLYFKGKMSSWRVLFSSNFWRKCSCSSVIVWLAIAFLCVGRILKLTL